MSGISTKLLGTGGSSIGTIEFVGATSATNTTTPSLSAITDLQTGDLVVCIGVRDSDVSGPTDFTLLSSGWSGWATNFPAFNNNNNIANIASYKTMGATVDTGQTYEAACETWCAIAFRNATVDSPVVTSFATSTGTSLNPPAISIDTGGSAVVQMCFLDDDNSSLSTVSTGYTKAAEAGFNDGTTGCSSAICYRLNLPAGSHDPDTYIWSSSDSQLYRALRLLST